MEHHNETTAAPVHRLSVVADADLVESLRDHQRRVEAETGLRVSLSQVAGSLMRRGLAHERPAQA